MDSVKALRLAFALALTSSWGGSATADMLFQQASHFPGAFNFYTSDYGRDGVGSRGFQTFDDFRLTNTTNLTGITFQVLYLDIATASSNPVGIDTTSWEVSIRSDDSNAPGSVVFQETKLVGQVESTFVANTTLESGSVVPVYNIAFSFTNLFTALGGTTYWVSPFSLSPTFNPITGWMSGTGGNNASYQWTLGDARTVSAAGSAPNDRAFALVGVPEPSSVGLLGLGLGVGYRLVRKKRPRVV